jgi:hypothetical protein
MARIAHFTIKSDKNLFLRLKQKSRSFFDRITPKNITPNKELVVETDLSFSAILNPTKAVKCENNNLMIGLDFEKDKNCWKDFGSIPEGNYIIKRENKKFIEFATDYQATKSLWFYFDDKLFICSSSQRFIIYLLGDFNINEQAVYWMLSSGTLGLYNSWDKRIQSLPAATILKLNKLNWNIYVNTQTILFESNNKPLSVNLEIMDSILNETFNYIKPDGIKLLLSMTGGFDSRTNFLYLKKKNIMPDITTIGVRETVFYKYSDLYCAKQFAEKYGLKWLPYYTEWDFDKLDHFFDQFIGLGEGRLDLLERCFSGNEWMVDVFDQGYDIIVNGMEGFSGGRPFSSERINLQSRKLFMLKDYRNFSDMNMVEKQKLHEDLEKKSEDKTWPQYYHRLKQLFFNPYADSALNEILNCYVDTINPLLTKSMVRFIRKLPDSQRIEKAIAKKLVLRMDDSKIPFSNQLSVYPTKDLVSLNSFSDYFEKFIKYNNCFFPDSFINKIQNSVNNPEKKTLQIKCKNSLTIKKDFLKKLFPSLSHKFIECKQTMKPLDIDSYMLKYRVFIVLKILSIIKDDIRGDAVTGNKVVSNGNI